MKYAALVSGGKDSIYSILQCQELGHELVVCIHLAPPPQLQEESYMYQSAGSEVLVSLVEECLQVPLVIHRRKGKSINTSLVYDTTHQEDEVEDLFQAVQTTLQQFPQVQALCSGAILSTYQRTRIEQVCQRCNLTSWSYLWRRNTQQQLLQDMINSGLQAVLVRTASPPGLMPHKHLGKSIQQLQPHFLQLFDKYQFHVCGEGGEYETLVLDCPIFRKRLVLDQVQIRLDDDNDDSSGILVIQKWHTEVKTDMNAATSMVPQEHDDETSGSTVPSTTPQDYKQPSVLAPITTKEITTLLNHPHVCRKSNGVLHISEIVAPTRSIHSDPAQATVEEFLQILSILHKTLQFHECTPQDVCFVHLYLSSISHFSLINEYYRHFFGVMLPPSRSCVGVASVHRHITLDALVMVGSGDYLRTPTTSENAYTKIAAHMSSARLRQVLHVQSWSHWAPVCVGPYSQANTLYGALHVLAGQIGLIPATMTLADGFAQQLRQTWRNVANVLDALGASCLDDILNGLLYVSDVVFYTPGALEEVREICRESLANNADIQSGAVDNLVQNNDNDLDGYEDEETMLELRGRPLFETAQSCHLLVVAVPEMPVGALVEVEVIAATREAAKYLTVQKSIAILPCKRPGHVYACDEAWDSGYDPTPSTSASLSDGSIQCRLQSLAKGHVTCATITLTLEAAQSLVLDPRYVLAQMLSALSRRLGRESSALTLSDLLTVRLYHIGFQSCDDGSEWRTTDDGCVWREALASELAKVSPNKQAAASTVVSVRGLHVICESVYTPYLAIQAVLLDPARLASDMWINVGR